MDRRELLKSIAALPIVPAFLRPQTAEHKAPNRDLSAEMTDTNPVGCIALGLRTNMNALPGWALANGRANRSGSGIDFGVDPRSPYAYFEKIA